MSISPFFHNLRSAYQAEINDLAFDSEGQDVLRKRLIERRKELRFLLQMMELSPEMVAVVFHQGFVFKQPAVMDHLLSQESDELPTWDSLSDAIQMPEWATELSRTVLKEPMGEWFLAVAAGLEYMYNKPDGRVAEPDEEDDDDAPDGDNSDDRSANSDSDDAQDPSSDKAREDAAADWLAEQGFDRKD